MKTLKALVAKYNAASLILRILVGLLVGVVLALVVPGAGWVEEFGSLFVGALKGIAPVLVSSSWQVHWHRAPPNWTAGSVRSSGCIC